jgi:hypothetical protein
VYKHADIFNSESKLRHIASSKNSIALLKAGGELSRLQNPLDMKKMEKDLISWWYKNQYYNNGNEKASHY